MVKRISRIPRIYAEISEEVATAFKQALKVREHREAQLADGRTAVVSAGARPVTSTSVWSPSWTLR